MRATVLLWCFFAVSCKKCDDRVTLKDLLSKPGVTLKLANVDIGEPQSCYAEINWRDPPKRCPRLDPALEATIDGIPAEVELGGERPGENLEALRCARPRIMRLDVPKLDTGQERHFVLEDHSVRVEANLQWVWESATFAQPGPWPGPGGRWFVSWSGPKPRDAVLGNARLGVAPADGGFELLLPDPLEGESPLHLEFPTWVVTKCSFGTCEGSGLDFWDFELDGGAVTNFTHTVL